MKFSVRPSLRKILLVSLACNIVLLGAMLHYRIKLKNLFEDAMGPGRYMSVPSEFEDARYSLTQFNFHSQPEVANLRVAFLGDSIIAETNFAELLGRDDVVNRGISGDLSISMPARLKYLLTKKPEVLVIEGGINDILSRASIARVVQSKKEILAFCKINNIRPVFLKTLAVGKDQGSNKHRDAKVLNAGVVELNAAIEEIARDAGATVVDFDSILMKDGFLKAELTDDGVHLNARGKRLYADQIKAAL